MMIYRVHYPLLTQDGHRDFADEAEAQAFAVERRESIWRYGTIHDWRRVEIEAIEIADDPSEPAWFAFKAYNSQTVYGWGTAEQADRYADHLNARREINRYAPVQVIGAEADELASRTDTFDLDEALSAIEEASA